MTKKDYELIAKCIRETRATWFNESERQAQVAITHLVYELAEELERTNMRFNKDRFIDACAR